ncbi:MAG: GrdX family protein [Clostridia bacterium]|nr:GrdX family protein [Clostridia bacterium]
MNSREVIIVTNNQSVYDTYHESFEVEYLENQTFLQVLEYCRDAVHLGRKLLTHPLTGSVKPNETPFKSVMITKVCGVLEMDSLNLIESAIHTTKKFLNDHEVKAWPDRILDDFRLIDFRLIKSGIESIQ